MLSEVLNLKPKIIPNAELLAQAIYVAPTIKVAKADRDSDRTGITLALTFSANKY